jgi:hypothetical protein
LEAFRLAVEALEKSPEIEAVLVDPQRVQLSRLTLDQVTSLLGSDAGLYFLMAAAKLNRTSLKRAIADPEAQVVAQRRRRSYAVLTRLPVEDDFKQLAAQAIALRSSDLQRRARGQVEQLFRERLADEEIPLLMSPPVRIVSGALIVGRKPDGVWPDPKLGLSPKVYLEIKNIRRVSDDIQKRLYELAEASLEMKLLYSDVNLSGLALTDTSEASSQGSRDRLRAQILGHAPVVIGLFLCSRDEAERYRAGAHAFVDRIFFQEEIDECLTYLKFITSEASWDGSNLKSH